MKKIKLDRESIFQIIYLVSSIVFLITIPIIVVINSKTIDSNYTSITKPRTIFCMGFSIYIFIVFLINLVLDREKLKSLINRKIIYLFIGLLLLCYLSTSFSSNVSKSLYGVEYRYNGFIQYLSYFCFATLGYALNDKNRKIYFRIFSFVALAIAVLNIYNLKIGGTYLPTNDLSGIFYNINHYGYFISYSSVIIMFLYFSEKNIILKIVDYIVYLLSIWILIANNTFGTYISVMITLITICFYSFKKECKIQYILLVIGFAVLSITTKYNGEYNVKNNFVQLLEDFKIIKTETNNSDYPLGNDNNMISYVGNYRGKLWIYAFKYSLEKPIVGYGLDNLNDRYSKDNISIDNPHNLILNLAATIGYPGMIMYISALIILIIKGAKKVKENDHIKCLILFVLINHFISSMFGITIYYVTPYFIIILGMAVKIFDDNDNKKMIRN